MEVKVWFKSFSLEFRWHKVPLEGIKNVAGIKRAIKAMMKDMFDRCLSEELTIKATKIGEEDAGCAVVLGRREDLESILRRFGVEDHHPSIQAAFAKNIRLFVSSARSDQLTERELLTLRPYTLCYKRGRRREKKSSTIRTLGTVYAPTSVVGWQDFTREARLLALDDTTRCYDEPRFVHQEASGNLDVQYVLNMNVLYLLSDTIGSDQMPKEVFCRHEGHRGVQGEPTFLLVGGDRLRLAIEVKTKWDLPRKDIRADRTPAVSVIDHIIEIYAYMGHNELQYGILSTYESTWFLRRPPDDPNKLLISDSVATEAANPTLLQCFAYIMSLARRSPNSPAPFLAPQSPPTADCKPPSEKCDDASNRSQAGTEEDSEEPRVEQPEGSPELENFGWDGLKVIDVLGYGRRGTVYKAVLRGEEVSYKLFDLWKHPDYEEEFLHEGEIYTYLKELQGHTIPKLKGFGYTAGGFLVFATEIAGSPIIVEELSDQERNEIVTALSGIHDRGILHNDIRPENILIQRHSDGFKVMFIDFSLSRDISKWKEPREEMATLKRLLDLPPLIKDDKSKQPPLPEPKASGQSD